MPTNELYQKLGMAFMLSLKRISKEELLQMIKDMKRILEQAKAEYDHRVDAEMSDLLAKRGITLDNPYHPSNRGFDGPTGAE